MMDPFKNVCPEYKSAIDRTRDEIEAELEILGARVKDAQHVKIFQFENKSDTSINSSINNWIGSKQGIEILGINLQSSVSMYGNRDIKYCTVLIWYKEGESNG